MADMCRDWLLCLLAIVFIVQHLFDEAQIIADNVGPPVTRQQWQYLYRLGLDIRNSLSNVSYVLVTYLLIKPRPT